MVLLQNTLAQRLDIEVSYTYSFVISHTVFPTPTSLILLSSSFRFYTHHPKTSFSINESLVQSARFVYILPDVFLGHIIKLSV